MEETIFFNRGNALAAKFDPKELMRDAQIEQDKRQISEKLIIVKDPQTGEHILFSLADEVLPPEKATAFQVYYRMQ